jgi:sulfite reductase alpha subunit-like flavoprotein
VAILYPENSPEDVETLLKRLGWEDEADKPIRISLNSEGDVLFQALIEISLTHSLDRSLPLGYPGPDVPTTLRSLITKHVDINSVPRKSFVELLSYFTKDQKETDKLREFCTAEGLVSYCHGRILQYCDHYTGRPIRLYHTRTADYP